MKTLLKPLLKYYLKYISKIALFVHKPIIIAIAGSTNKSFVKNEIKKVLKEKGFNVRANAKNFNTEFGLPLAVLDLPSGYNSFRNWLPIIKQAPKKIFSKNFPKFLVLSLGTSDPGDIKYLLSIIKPQISIITNITQRYLEGFSDMNELVNEYKILANKITTRDLLILNYDNPRLRLINSDAKKIFFGYNAKADWQALNIIKVKNGQQATIKHNKQFYQLQIDKFGEHHVYAHLIAQIIKSYVTE